MSRHKNDFSEITYGFYSIVRNNLSEKSSHVENCFFSELRYGFLKFKLLRAKLSYLVIVPEVRNRR